MSVFKSIFGDSEKKKETATTVKAIGPPSATEAALLDRELALASRQLGALSQLGSFTNQQFQEYMQTLTSEAKPTQRTLTNISNDNLWQSNYQLGFQDELLRGEIDAINRGTTLSPDQDALITAAANAAIESGLSDIGQFRDESLRALAQETAPARGLRPDDTPILDVGGRVLNEAQRQASDYITQVRGQEAQARLDYPIRAGEYIASRTQAQQGLAQNTANFVEQLRQEAFNNRLRLTALVGQTGATNAAFAPSPSTLLGLQQIRAAGAPVTQSGSAKASSFSGTDVLGAVGGVLTGLGAIGISDPDAKTDIRPVGDIRGIPLYKFRYKGDSAEHVGVMADEVPIEYVIQNPGGYDMVKYGELLRDL